jgi:serine/threonine protein kinase
MTSGPENLGTSRAPETVDLVPGAGVTPAPPSTGPTVNRDFGDYELLGEIERGGMGIVYHARERHSGRLVALKMMLAESASSPADLSRFILEAQAAGELHHPGVVAIHAWGVHNGHPFYTMDFVPGQPLHRLLAGGPFAPARAVRYLSGIAKAVHAAHVLGIVHRDLKPSNVMIDSADQPRVLDFGLAKRQRTETLGPESDEILDALPADGPSPSVTGATPRVSGPITEKGAILGTPSYMAPEQVRADHERVGPPADVHSLGAIFYEMLSGRPPFQAESTYLTLTQVLEKEPVPLRSLVPGIPRALDTVCTRCLAKDPRQRYHDAGALVDDLERRWRRSTLGARFARLALLALAAIIVLQVLQPLMTGTAYDHHGLRGLIQSLLPSCTPLQEAAGVLDRLLNTLLYGAPLVAGLGLLAWSGAWVWFAERRIPVCGGWVVAGIFTLLLWSALGFDFWDSGGVFLPWVLLANSLVAIGILMYARWSSSARTEEPVADAGGTYLQKLFTVRGTARQRKSGIIGRPAELADFELGQTLHVWEGGAVYWARQRSLDRAVLVWRDSQTRPDGAQPGVVVRHPLVLNLHALSSSPEGRLLVTEPVAASPLSEVLGQRSLTPREAATLTARLAEAIQAFHDQGVCHGRLRAEWILVRGDLEPVLCPCGIPEQTPAARSADIVGLGELLRDWLPSRPVFWRYEAMAPLYRVCDAACTGEYERAADVSADLGRAVRAGQMRWRERGLNVFVLILLLLPWLLLPLRAFSHSPGEGWLLARNSMAFLAISLLVVCSAAVLFGYAQTRSLVLRRRLCRGSSDRILPGGMRYVLFHGLGFWSTAALLGGVGLLDAGQGLLLGLPALLGIVLGFWWIGASVAGIVTFGEFLAASLRREHSAPPPDNTNNDSESGGESQASSEGRSRGPSR